MPYDSYLIFTSLPCECIHRWGLNCIFKRCKPFSNQILISHHSPWFPKWPNHAFYILLFCFHLPIHLLNRIISPFIWINLEYWIIFPKLISCSSIIIVNYSNYHQPIWIYNNLAEILSYFLTYILSFHHRATKSNHLHSRLLHPFPILGFIYT